MARVFSWLPRLSRQIEKKHFPTTSAFMIPANQPVWMRREYTKFADEGFRRNVIAHRCIAMVASAAASVPWKLAEGGWAFHRAHPPIFLPQHLQKPL